MPAASPGALAAPAGSLRRRGSDDIMPGRAPAALTQESPGETRGAARGHVPLPSPAPTAWSASPSLPTMDTSEANCFNSTRIQQLFFSTEIRRRGEEKQRTITLSFKQESHPGSTTWFKALSKSHQNQQRPFPFISAQTGGGYNLRHNSKALSVTESCIFNNTTNSRKSTGIPASSYAVTLP